MLEDKTSYGKTDAKNNERKQGFLRNNDNNGARNNRDVEIKPQWHKGNFKWFDFEKGYGFITPENKNESDMFIHVSCLDGNLLAVLREAFAGGRSLSEYVASYQVAIPKNTPGSARRNSNKPFAVNVKLASQKESGDIFNEDDLAEDSAVENE